MRRISFFIMSTLAVLVLLFSYRTSLGDTAASGAAVVSEAKVLTTTSTSAAGAGPDPLATTAPTDGQVAVTRPDSTTATTTTPAPAATGAVTVQGATENTRYGNVQIQLTVDNSTITDVTALQYPNTDRKDQQINSRAIPQLVNQVLSAQSAQIDGVSGATYTTDGFVASVQSALDAAGVAS